MTVTGESGSAELGRSVSLAGDGTTAVAGGPGNGAGAGAAWVFTEGGEGWTQSAELAPGLIKGKGGAFGTDVSIAGDGETILAGEPKAKTAVGGAAWVFTLQAGEWSRLAVPLTGGGRPSAPTSAAACRCPTAVRRPSSVARKTTRRAPSGPSGNEAGARTRICAPRRLAGWALPTAGACHAAVLHSPSHPCAHRQGQGPRIDLPEARCLLPGLGSAQPKSLVPEPYAVSSGVR